MLRINRLRIRITATNKTYSFDRTFQSGINLIASDGNTKGKSSVIEAIYYALGLEEIIGGTNEKVLTSVYKSRIQDGEESWNVIKSAIFLEVNNGRDTVTLYRTVNDEQRDSRLITVYLSDIRTIDLGDANYEDYYVHYPYAAVNERGFHSFLEKFLNFELPKVPTTDRKERKLYLQLVFSALFIEQKKGWASIYSSMPYLGIRDSKKRVTEFILDLHTFENERRRMEVLYQEKNQTDRWIVLYKSFFALQKANHCIVDGIPPKPEVLPQNLVENIEIRRAVDTQIGIDDWIKELEIERNNLETKKPKISENYEKIKTELENVENTIYKIENEERNLISDLSTIRRNEKRAKTSLETIISDIRNNSDARRLKELGSDININIFRENCPVCGHFIQDTFLPVQHETQVMSFDESINHLRAQKSAIEFLIASYKDRIKEVEEQVNEIREKKRLLMDLAMSLRRDIFSIDDDLSEALLYKRIEIGQHIDKLNEFKSQVKNYIQEFSEASDEWMQLQEKKAGLPQNALDNHDEEIKQSFESRFVELLRLFNYSSVGSFKDVGISDENYMPIINSFDMRFDSSASDNIRAIWAYTIALALTSKFYKANWPGIIIFDEPGQHSIGSEDMRALLNELISGLDQEQAIIGITLNSKEIKKVVTELGEKANCIYISDKAFT